MPRGRSPGLRPGSRRRRLPAGEALGRGELNDREPTCKREEVEEVLSPEGLCDGWSDRWVLDGAGRHEAPKGCDFPPHRHRTWEFTYYLRGCIPCPIGDEVPWSHPGVVLLTPPGVLHSERAVTGYANYYLCVEVAGTPSLPRVLHDDGHGTLQQLFSMIVREWQTHRSKSPDVVELLMLLLARMLARSWERKWLSPAEQVVREAEHIMDSRFPSPLKIQDVAREVGVSTSTLRIYFAKLRGTTPIHYLQELRVRQALARIRDSDASLETIAELCGYDSPSHLSRHVKRVTGRTPGSFRGPYPATGQDPLAAVGPR
jgi:AraC-like DNA-binding protein